MKLAFWIRNWPHIATHLVVLLLTGGDLFKKAEGSCHFKSDWDKIWQDCVQVNIRGVRTADADIRGPRSAAFLANADGPWTCQTNTSADADHPRIWNHVYHDQPFTNSISLQLSKSEQCLGRWRRWWADGQQCVGRGGARWEKTHWTLARCNFEYRGHGWLAAC